ncbi:MAG: hypothetical protein GY943_18925 [Chloroflexi bacterium]|nr:hypothetical protein [Chloroflexota bacterium]
MKEVVSVEKVLEKGQTAVIIFTRDHHTKIHNNASGQGYTGSNIQILLK